MNSRNSDQKKRIRKSARTGRKAPEKRKKKDPDGARRLNR